jgi:hypothetical protein
MAQNGRAAMLRPVYWLRTAKDPEILRKIMLKKARTA